jgi:hypothetical protein
MSTKRLFTKALSVVALAGIIPCTNSKTSSSTVNAPTIVNINRGNVLELNANTGFEENSSITNKDYVSLPDGESSTHKSLTTTFYNPMYSSWLNNSTPLHSKSYLPSVNDTMEEENSQDVFEENYVSKGRSWEEGGKFIYQLVSNIGMVAVGAASENPVAIVSGIMGLIGSLGENLNSSGATIQNVMDQLKETDRKIDELGAKLEQNTQQLADEIVRAEALVDQSNLNTLNLAINDFATNSIGKINTFNRDLADEIGNYYKDFVQSSQTIRLALEKDPTSGKYKSSSLSDLTNSPNYNFSITLTDFTNSKNHLRNSNNIIESGFMDELSKDIENAISLSHDLPEGIDKEDLNGFIQAMIYEQFMKKYFSTHKEKAQEYRNLIIDYAERIIGASGKVSILSTYLNRLKCMYNFAGEIKPLVRTLSANMMKVLDMNTARAAEASLFAEYSYSELEKDYKSASSSIQDFYKSVKKTDDSYSYTTSATLTGGFYQAKYSVNYFNPGNECKLKVNFNVDELSMNGDKVERTKDDLESHDSISQNEHARISTRWTLLSSIGSSNPTYDYIDYLVANKVIPQNSLDAYQYIVSSNETTKASYRILTDNRKVRDLNSTDLDTVFTCEGRGNPDGDYFELNKTYKYRGRMDAASWYGKTYEGAFVDGRNGTAQGTQKIASWARYAESHWYWYEDEYWAFTDNTSDNYYFLVDAVATK